MRSKLTERLNATLSMYSASMMMTFSGGLLVASVLLMDYNLFLNIAKLMFFVLLKVIFVANWAFSYFLANFVR